MKQDAEWKTLNEEYALNHLLVYPRQWSKDAGCLIVYLRLFSFDEPTCFWFFFLSDNCFD